MSSAIELLIKHGYLVLFLVVMAEQAGLPVPATPVLIAAGALAGLHDIHMAQSLALAAGASLISDTLWFWFSGYRGAPILILACHDDSSRSVKDACAQPNRCNGWNGSNASRDDVTGALECCCLSRRSFGFSERCTRHGRQANAQPLHPKLKCRTFDSKAGSRSARSPKDTV